MQKNNPLKQPLKHQSQERLPLKQVQLKFSKEKEIENKMKLFADALKECQGSNIRLKMITDFENDQAVSKFQTLFFKLTNNSFKYLTWEISGNFTDSTQGKSIGDIVSRLRTLYSLTINIRESYFSDSGATALAKGLKQLINLHELKIICNGFQNKIYIKMTDQGLVPLLETLYSLPNIQILEHNLYSSKDFNYPPLLASFPDLSCQYHPMEIPEGFEGNVERAIKFISERRNMITKITLDHPLLLKENLISIEKKYLRQLEMCLQLPYLSQFSTSLYNNQEFKPIVSIYENILLGLASSRRKKILEICSFNQILKGFIPIDLCYLLVDLFIT